MSYTYTHGAFLKICRLITRNQLNWTLNMHPPFRLPPKYEKIIPHSANSLRILVRDGNGGVAVCEFIVWVLYDKFCKIKNKFFTIKMLSDSISILTSWKMPLIEQLTSSPVRKLLLPSDAPLALLRPYGGSTAFKVLDYFLGTPDIITKVCCWSSISIQY